MIGAVAASNRDALFFAMTRTRQEIPDAPTTLFSYS
jgi:hypothetical protein